jgi:radical SAM superfamily enzyme YgiQ (UPF0313 family)
LDRKKKSRLRHSTLSGQGHNSRKTRLDQEKGSYLKKWTGRLPVAVLYPNSYRVGMSNLGFQIVYHLLNENDRIVCERVFLPDKNESELRSVESSRPLTDFPVLFCSVSFEHDYVNVAKLLLMSGIEPLAERRLDTISGTSPLLVCGGVTAFMNPEPLAAMVDLFVVGEAEPLLPPLVERLCENQNLASRNELLLKLNREKRGYYAPRFYQPEYDANSHFHGYRVEPGLPQRIKKVILETKDRAAHSQLLTPETEFADLYLTELGRGCSRGCRFCTAGFIYRPARLWDKDAVLASLKQCPDDIRRVGLLGMEMTSEESIESIAEHIGLQGCSLSFSSLRADRISENLLSLLSKSELKSVAIAPDGGSERLRKVINKGLSESDLISAATRLVEAGLFKLKLYLMIGLPTETDRDLHEFIQLVRKILHAIKPFGQQRGRLTEIVVSVNSFTPKPWTPFQYHPFGESERLSDPLSITGTSVVKELKRKITLLKRELSVISNVRMTFDNPEHVLFQSVLARGDRRIGPLLIDMAASGISWKRAMKQQGLNAEQFATRQYSENSYLPWRIIDHSINDSYLWKEYCKAFKFEETVACDTDLCRRCGVCND